MFHIFHLLARLFIFLSYLHYVKVQSLIAGPLHVHVHDVHVAMYSSIFHLVTV